MKYEQRIHECGYMLPSVAEVLGVYVPAVRAGDVLFLAGVIPEVDDELKYKGKLGKELAIKDGREAAKICVLNALSAIKDCIGDLDKVKRFIRVIGYINSAPGFTEQPKVLDGASEFLVEIFGEKGKHARLAIGVAELPVNAPIELEMIVQIEQE